MKPGIFVIQTINIGHEEEIVRMHHSGRNCRECIVVAEFDFCH